MQATAVAIIRFTLSHPRVSILSRANIVSWRAVSDKIQSVALFVVWRFVTRYIDLSFLHPWLSVSASGCGMWLPAKTLEQTESDVDMQLPGVGDAVKPQQWGSHPGKVPYGVSQWLFGGGGVSITSEN